MSGGRITPAEVVGKALVRLSSGVTDELRIAWAKGLRVSLQVDGDETRVEGHVTSVAATGGHVVVDGLHVPTHLILAVFRPSRLGDSTFDERRESWTGRIPRAVREDPNQLRIPGFD